MKEYSKGIYVKFKPEEVEILHDRMKEAGVQNMSAYIRKMAINGYVIIPEWPGLNRVISLHTRISNNLNQYAKKANETGKLYEEDTKNKDFGEAMIEAFGPDKADVIYDCAGNNITMGQAIKYARKGSTIVLVAVFAGMAEIDLAVANDHELDIKSTMMYRHDDYIDGIRLVNEGKVHLRPLISKTFDFKDYLKAYQYIDDNRETTMKVIINVSEK